MHRLYFLILLGFFLLPGCSTTVKEKTPVKIEQTRAGADEYLWDFGQISQGQVLKHEFVVKNRSSVVLNLKDATTSCGCTVLEFKKKVLQPAESTTIEVKFDSKGYLGPTQQFVYLNTDSVDNPVIRFIIKANVTKE